MKKLIFIAAIFMLITSCDNEKEAAPKPEIEMTAEDSIQIYSGNFITAGNKAVLKGDKFIFEVKMDSFAKSLKELSAEYQLNDTNVIPVEVKGKVIENEDNSAYSQVIEIKEILSIIATKKPVKEQIEK